MDLMLVPRLIIGITTVVGVLVLLVLKGKS